MESKDGKVKASIEEVATYNMLLTEAIFELLADKGASHYEGRSHGTHP